MWTCELSREDSRASGFVSQKTFDISGYEDWFSVHSSEIVSGVSMFSVKGAHLSGGKLLFPPGIEPLLQNPSKGITPPPLLAPVEGTRKAIVFRVRANDVTSTSEEAELGKSVFGTSGKPTLKSQFEACSYNKIQFIPFTGKTTTGEDISNGVTTIEIGTEVIGKNDTDIASEVEEAAVKKLGGLEQFDHFLISLPRGVLGHDGTTNWVGWALIPGRKSVYNDDSVKGESVQMHEIGHNLGLFHSTESKTWHIGGNETHKYEEYGDRSGMMGASSNAFPLKCFNGPKSWDLGWYSDRHVTFDPLGTRWFFGGNFVGVADYDNSDGKHVVARITGGNTDYYISFNRKKGINANTQEGCNMVMLHSKNKQGLSNLVAKLKVGTTHIIPNFTSSFNLEIGFNSLQDAADPWVAFVVVVKTTRTPSTSDPSSCCEAGPDKESNRPCWEDGYGDTCWDYADVENFCYKYGDTPGTGGRLGNLTALQACCACECAASTQSFELSDGSDVVQGEAVV